MLTRELVVGVIGLSLGLLGMAQAATFQGLGDFPGGGVESIARGVSSDGTVPKPASVVLLASDLAEEEVIGDQ